MFDVGLSSIVDFGGENRLNAISVAFLDTVSNNFHVLLVKGVGKCSCKN